MSNVIIASVVPAIIGGLVFGLVSGSVGITVRHFMTRWGFPAAFALVMGILIGSGSGIAFTSTLRTTFDMATLVSTCGILGGVLPWAYTASIFRDADEVDHQ